MVSKDKIRTRDKEEEHSFDNKNYWITTSKGAIHIGSGENIHYWTSGTSDYSVASSKMIIGSGDKITYKSGASVPIASGPKIIKGSHITIWRAKIADKGIELFESGELVTETILKKLDELATKDDVIESQRKIISEIKIESQKTQEHLKSHILELQNIVMDCLPHTRVFRTSLYFLLFFFVCIISKPIFSINIMQDFWAWFGLFVSLGFLILSYLMLIDWKKKIGNKVEH